MPYRTHHSDRHAQVCMLADILEGIPQQETAGLLVEAEKMLLAREFGQKGLGRNAKPKDLYWFEHHLIAEAKALVHAGKPLQAYLNCLNDHNHDRSGFVGQTRRVYRRPINDAERAISKEIRQMIIKVATALINSAPLSKKMDLLGEGWNSVIAIFDCLIMLGESVPKRLIERLRLMIAECKKIKTKNHTIPQLEHAFKNRFG